MTALAAIVYTLCAGPRILKLLPTTARVLSQGLLVQRHQDSRSTRYGGTYTAKPLIPTWSVIELPALAVRGSRCSPATVALRAALYDKHLTFGPCDMSLRSPFRARAGTVRDPAARMRPGFSLSFTHEAKNSR